MALPLAVVAEDKLTQAVLHKLVHTYLPEYAISRSEVKNGRGNVQKSLAGYASLANVMPVIVGVDLDHDECASTLLAGWADEFDPHPNLIIRVAVTEIESWVLADRKRCADFINATSDEISRDPDSLENPKKAFLDLARANAHEELKKDLVPRNYDRNYPRIGPAYNLRMTAFVASRWRPHVARPKSDSLHRAITAMEKLA